MNVRTTRTATLVAVMALTGTLASCQKNPPERAPDPTVTPGAAGSAGAPGLGPGSSSAPAAAEPSAPAAPAAGAASPGAEDNSFVMAAAAGGRAEAEAGRLMAGRAIDPQVRAFAEQLDKDHTAANTALERIANQKGIPLPQGVPPVAREHLDELKSLSGAEADAAFLRHFGSSAHEDTIALFERQASSGQVPELRSFAADTVAKLREHLSIARQLEQRLATEGGRR